VLRSHGGESRVSVLPKGARAAPLIFIKQPVFQGDVAADGVSFQLFLPIGNIVVPVRGTRERQARSLYMDEQPEGRRPTIAAAPDVVERWRTYT